MAYNTGNFTLFKESATVASIFANLQAPKFNIAGSVGSLVGSYVAPVVSVTGAATIGTVYPEAASLTLSVANSRVVFAATVNVSGPSLSGGTVTNAFSLFVTPATGAGTIQNNFSAYFDRGVGFGTTTPKNAVDVFGNVAVGTYAGALSAPSNGMIISGVLGVANATPSYAVDVIGQAGATRIYSPQTTQVGQLFQVSEGWNQGYGISSVGTQLTMSAQTSSFFDTARLQSNSIFFTGSVFDGRYLYFVPFNNNAGGQVTRYDATRPFSASQSYSFYNTAALQSNSVGFNGGAFDGRYVYLVPFATGKGQVTRYDSTGNFSSSTSYNFFNMLSLQSNSAGFASAIFDGRYLYFIPYQGGGASFSGVMARYDTMGSFSSTGSYSFFDTSSVQSNSGGFSGGVFDGRYLYLIPYLTRFTYSGQVTRFDTTRPFSSSSSYTFFNLTTVNSSARGFSSQVFDGRYVYMASYGRGVIGLYDTTAPFSSSLSYRFFDTSTLQSNSAGFGGAVFDGRYVYYSPLFNNATQTFYGQLTRYDITGAFTSTSSYAFFNLQSLQSNCKGFYSMGFDGQYVYFIPYASGTAGLGTVVRMNAYGSVSLQALSTLGASNGLTLLGGGGVSLSDVDTQGSAAAGSVGFPAQVAGYLSLVINGATRRIPFYNN